MNRRRILVCGAATVPAWLALSSAAAAQDALVTVPPTPAVSEGSASASAAPGDASVIGLLVRQARYWRDRSQFGSARAALARAAQVAPRDPDVLQAQAELALAEDDREAAQRYRDRLQAVAPGSTQLSALAQAFREQAIDPGALTAVREDAARGDTAAAVAGYQSLFGKTPPRHYASEYFQTLAGTGTGWSEARNGLSGLVAHDPNDLGLQLAYARTLTYRDATRLQGIARLQALAKLEARAPSVAEAARDAWRQALLWLPNDPASATAFRAWLQGHPDDSVIAERLSHSNHVAVADPAAAERAQGFSDLAAGQLDAAAGQFSAALARSSVDADALGGLGLVRAKQDRATEAADLLRRAIAADPDHGSRWKPALDGLAVGADYAEARQLIAAGHLAEAQDRLRAILARPGETTGARLMLAEVQRRRGDIAAAAASFDTVLEAAPDNADALLGLARLDLQQGRTAQANALLARLGGRRGREVAAIEAQQNDARETARIDEAGSDEDRIALLRQAVERDGADPWLRLRLARLLEQQHRPDEARTVMAPVASGQHPGVAALQAAILFAGDQNDYAEARRLLALLPRSGRTADTAAVANRAALAAEIDGATADGFDGRERLLELASRPDPSGDRGAAIAAALRRLGDPGDAARALRVALRATAVPTATQLLSYAGSALSAGDRRDASAMLATLDRTGLALTPDQQRARTALAAGLAVVEADALNQQGRRADAYDRLAPILASDPGAAAPQLALGRLYQSDSQPRKALALDLAVLRQQPADMDARLAATRAAVDCGEMQQAGQLARDAITIDPQDPRAWLAAAAVHHGRGDAVNEMADLRRARQLRRQQLGLDDASGVGLSDSAVTGDDGNPFRHDGGAPVASPADDTDPTGLDGAEAGAEGRAVAVSKPADPLLASIDGQIGTLQDQTAPRLDVDLGLRSRSGSGGLDSLTELSVPVTATLPIGTGASRWFATLTPTTVDSGTLDTATAVTRRFGSLALNDGTVGDGRSSQAGLGLKFGYQSDWLNADLGSSPLGFATTNVLGGVELAPKLSSNVTLRLLGERRAVTDSVLSYGGERDPGTGLVWGGVTRIRGHAQLEVASGTAVLYAGGGYSALDGTRVANNSEVEAGAGGSVQVWRAGTQTVRVGLDLTYFGYDHNLRYFTLGQGGYFSPQSYVAAVVPLTWTGTSGKWNWTVAGSVGFQSYVEHASPLFPDDPALQRALEAGGGIDNYAGDTVSGFTGGASGKLDYALTPTLHLDASASYQRAGNWDEARALLGARYIFSGTP